MKGEKLGHIDLARGLAILLVILHHQAQAVLKVGDPGSFVTLVGEYGQMGVILFFVASAMTLCRSADNRRDEPAPLRSFYLRRFFRIAPLYYCGIVLYGAVQWITHGEAGPYTLRHVAENVLFIHGFDKGANNDIVPGGWSISAEMMFYAVFPFAFALMERLVRRWGVTVLAGAWLVSLGLYVGVWVLIPRFTPYELVRTNIFYYWPPGQVLVFAAGMIGYFAFHLRPGRLAVDALGFILPTAVALLLWRSGLVAVFAFIPACCAVSFVFLVSLLARLPGRRTTLHMMGEVSFSAYVLHFLAVWFLAPYVIRVVGPTSLGLVVSYGVTVSVVFLAASVSKWLIEDPGSRLGTRVVRSLSPGG